MKTGIVTHYYSSNNYGGCLQAYALCEFLKKHNIEAEQISYDYISAISNNTSIKKKLKSKLKSGFIKNVHDETMKLYFSCERLYHRFFKKNIVAAIADKKNAFKDFRLNTIPHSEKVYNIKNVKECVSDYDAFITGSDQVWNFICYNPGFYLDFVPSEKIKFSYAASIAADDLSDEQKNIFKKSLADFNDISVREKSAADLLRDISPKKPFVAVDPVLLLEKDDWDKLSDEQSICEPYVLCYFLGINKNSRKLAKKFAKKRNLKLISIPMLNGGMSFVDKGLGAKLCYDVGPKEFISLIKNAEYVFTDSFHATVFSIIFNREFFVFKRSKNDQMGSRLVDLLTMFNMKDRFLGTKEKENLLYINNLESIDYNQEFNDFISRKEKSEEFLLCNLQD